MSSSTAGAGEEWLEGRREEGRVVVSTAVTTSSSSSGFVQGEKQMRGVLHLEPKREGDVETRKRPLGGGGGGGTGGKREECGVGGDGGDGGNSDVDDKHG